MTIVVLDVNIIDQVSKVWEEPYFTRRSEDIDRALAASLMQFAAQKVGPDSSVRDICDDEEDDLVLGTAVAAKADFLVTGDKGLLRVGEYRGVRIVRAATFLDVLQDPAGGTG